MQRVRSLLVAGILVMWAGAAWAGATTTTTTLAPGVTTTTTTTTTGIPTTTTTTTTTTGVPTTTTTTTTTTGVPTTTTTTTSTTLPPTPTGSNQYLHRLRKSLYQDNQLATDVGEGFCVAGRIRGTDATMFPLRRVRFEYRSTGNVRKLSDKNARGEFSSVQLTLVIDEDESGTIFEATVFDGCRLKAALTKSGLRAKANLRCDLGSDLSAFELSEELLNNIRNAFPKRDGTGVQVDTKKGHIKVKHNGDEAPEDLEDETLTCFFD